MAAAGKWVVKPMINLRLESVALGRLRYCLLISVVQLEAELLVDTLHCKTEQRRALVLCLLGVQLAASWPIDSVRVLFWQITHTQF